MKKTVSVLTAFVMGQLVQLALQATSIAAEVSKPIWLCAGIGAAIVCAVIVGILVARRETETRRSELAPPAVIESPWPQVPERRRAYFEDQTY